MKNIEENGRLEERMYELIQQHESNSKVAKILKSEFPELESKKDFRTRVRYHRMKGIQIAASSISVDSRNVKHIWDKTNKDVSAYVTNPDYVSPDQDKFLTEFKELRDNLLKDIKESSVKVNKITRSPKKDPHALVISPSDLHIGKLALASHTNEEYNNNIAISRCLDGVDGLLKKAKGYDIDKIFFIAGNDILHIDNPKRTTTGGTPQDTDGMWYSNFILAKDLYLSIIDDLLKIAPVEFVFNPSNHDYTSGFYLAQLIEAYYSKNKNVTFKCEISHRKYSVYGDNLIGTTHGDGAKPDKLPLLMAHECSDWSTCSKRYLYISHIHHKTSKDYIGVTVESFRSPSAADGWHADKGFTGAKQAIEAFIHHPTNGQVARLTYNF